MAQRAKWAIFIPLKTLLSLLKLRFFFSLPAPIEVMRQSAVLVHIIYTEHSNFDLLGSTDSGRLRVLRQLLVWWVAMCLEKLVFAPGSGEAEWSWTHTNKRFCSRGQSCLLTPDLHSHTQSYCFPFIASCHSLCESLIRTMSFCRLISHFSNFLTLHNERGRNSKGLTQKEG